jgi:hypothetical protein
MPNHYAPEYELSQGDTVFAVDIHTDDGAGNVDVDYADDAGDAGDTGDTDDEDDADDDEAAEPKPMSKCTSRVKSCVMSSDDADDSDADDTDDDADDDAQSNGDEKELQVCYMFISSSSCLPVTYPV